MKSTPIKFLSAFILWTLASVGNGFAQTTTVTFQVDMSFLVEQNRFNPSTEFVDIAGNFNNWGNPGDLLTDQDGDLIYSTSIQATIGQSLQFKARINGEWLGREEFPGGGPNRSLPVTGNDTVSFWYNDETSGDLLHARFSSDRVFIQPNTTVQFLNQSEGNPVAFNWSFEGGEPQTSDVQHPQVQYASEGIFPVTLTVTDSAGNTHTTTAKRAIRAEPLQTRWWNNSVFYEIFVRSYQDSDGDGIGDFNGLTSRLDYLNDGDSTTNTDLGIDAIWLMPIHPSPSYHGYDVTDYRGIHPDYGTKADFKRFLNEAHARGIKVIIDFVLNHSSNQHPYFLESLDSNSPYRTYYVWNNNPPNQDGPWGQTVWHQRNNSYYYGLFWSGMPDLNFNNVQLKTELFDAANFWLDDMGVDGFRLDAVKYIHEDSTGLENTTATFQFWRDFQSSITQTNPNALTVGEAWTSTDEVVPYVEDEGLNFCFEFDLAGSIINSIYHGNATWLSEQAYESYRSFPFLQFGSFLTNHDMNRVRDVFGNDLQKNRLAANIMLTLPGVPFLYYGEEIGMNGIKPDPDIRTPMLWNNSRAAGFTTGNPWRNVNSDYATKNVQSMQEDTASLWWTYQQAIQTRNQHHALKIGRYLPVSSSYDSVFSFIRYADSQALLVVANLSESPAPITQLSYYFNTSWDHQVWSDLTSGSSLDPSHNGLWSTVSISGLKPLSLKIFVLDSVRTQPAGAEWLLYPNPADQMVYIKGPFDGTIRITVSNALGQLITDETRQTVQGEFSIPVNGNPGCYWITIHGSDIHKTMPVIIKP